MCLKMCVLGILWQGHDGLRVLVEFCQAHVGMVGVDAKQSCSAYRSVFFSLNPTPHAHRHPSHLDKHA